MRKYFIVIAIMLCSVFAKSQVLNYPVVYQEQSQWCWAGCSQSILAHYSYYISQCSIAEYVRNVITWTSYGSTNCCINANLGCNYQNYNWGYNGSIQDILQHFHSIMNTGVPRVLTTSEIASDIAANHVFVAHWAWPSGGGHFVVGYGISGSGSSATIYYMNPWVGEGAHFNTYDWMITGVNTMGDHTWDNTNRVTSFPPVNGVQQVSPAQENELVYPNPSTGEVWVNGAANDRVEVYNTTGMKVYSGTMKDKTDQLNLANLSRGMYIVKITSADGNKFAKLVLQ